MLRRVRGPLLSLPESEEDLEEEEIRLIEEEEAEAVYEAQQRLAEERKQDRAKRLLAMGFYVRLKGLPLRPEESRGD